MDIDKLFPSRFLKAADLNEGEEIILTITGISQEVMGQGQDQKAAALITFAELEKALVLNKTNANTICNLYGRDTDGWIGKKVTAYVTDVQYMKDMVPAIRFRTKPPTNGNSSKPASDPATTSPTEEAWSKYFELEAEAEALNIKITPPPDNVTAAGLVRIYASLEARVKKAKADGDAPF